MHPTIKLSPSSIAFLDQRFIPQDVKTFEAKTVDDVVFAIHDMVVRGAPAIGVAGAMGLVTSVRNNNALSIDNALEKLSIDAEKIKASRPTAVNLMWAVDLLISKITAMSFESTLQLQQFLEQEAQAMLEDDIKINKQIGENGKMLFPKGARVLTCCNTGSLATAGYGTALGVIRSKYADDKQIHVYACETRPRLQGAKLTAWELKQDNIPFTLITDNMAASLMQQGKIDCVIAGADRIAANGDTANKIGTYSLAVLAQYHQVPFYIAAPVSTIDWTIPDGSHIPIEMRDASEVTEINQQKIAPDAIQVYNPAFDVTPASLITKIITEITACSPDNMLSLNPASMVVL